MPRRRSGGRDLDESCSLTIRPALFLTALTTCSLLAQAAAADPRAQIRGEVDTELGRVWWLGPYGEPALYDLLYDHADPGPGITHEEFAIDSRAAAM